MKNKKREETPQSERPLRPSRLTMPKQREKASFLTKRARKHKTASIQNHTLIPLLNIIQPRTDGRSSKKDL